MDEPEQREKAEFNMAISYLNRINALLSACDQASISLDIYSWFHSLLATYRELSTWMKDEDIKTFNESILRINPEISLIYSKYKRNGSLEIQPKIYMELHDMELRLRVIANKAGLLMKIADDAMESLK